MTQLSSSAATVDRERDKVLADAVRRKDRKATAEFVEQYADALYSYVLQRIKPNVDDVDDLTQEIFLAACRGIADYRAAASLKAWLFGIARHKVEDYYRAKIRNVKLEEADVGAGCSVELDADLHQHQQREQIVKILDRLPEPYRLLLKWKYWDQKGTEEIAASLGRTPKAVERMLARSRERFRQEWEVAR